MGSSGKDDSPKAFVVGHRGFVGSAIARHLEAVGVRVIGVDRGSLAGLRGGEADYLFNAAGSSDRRVATSDPVASWTENVTETVEILRDFRCTRYVHVSSASVYPEAGEHARTAETVAIDATLLAPYGLQKYVAELAVRAHAPSWVILRLGPLIGPGLRKNSIFDLLHRGSLFVNPDSSMPYIDTREVARIAWELRDEVGAVYNVAGAGSVRLRDIARELHVHLPGEVERAPLDVLDVDISKLLSRTPVPDSREAVLNFAREFAKR